MTQLFTFESASLISSSLLNIHNDNCPICRCQLTEKCLECNDTNVECKSVLGICNHGYHLHCINTWLKTKKACPLDNQTWGFQIHGHKHVNCKHKYDKYKKYNMINNVINNNPNNDLAG